MKVKAVSHVLLQHKSYKLSCQLYIKSEKNYRHLVKSNIYNTLTLTIPNT